MWFLWPFSLKRKKLVAYDHPWPSSSMPTRPPPDDMSTSHSPIHSESFGSGTLAKAPWLSLPRLSV